MKRAASVAKKESRSKKKKPPASSAKFKFHSCAPRGTYSYALLGSVGILRDGKFPLLHCTGDLVNILPQDHEDDNKYAMLVLNLPTEEDPIPCLCPMHLLDTEAIQAAARVAKIKKDCRKSIFSRAATEISVTSVPARRGDVEGHLLLSGPKNIKGRVVGDNMLTSLKAGCIRVGAHSQQAYYTLDRRFSIKNNN
mmetsp:Transcript_35897/g.75569  ORF Transcript_35897/g.75569 Transcript_35897/m.75569 type:complete len:195 (+) Transcript_35897:276-860(+)